MYIKLFTNFPITSPIHTVEVNYMDKSSNLPNSSILILLHQQFSLEDFFLEEFTPAKFRPRT